MNYSQHTDAILLAKFDMNSQIKSKLRFLLYYFFKFLWPFINIWKAFAFGPELIASSYFLSSNKIFFVYW